MRHRNQGLEMYAAGGLHTGNSIFKSDCAKSKRMMIYYVGYYFCLHVMWLFILTEVFDASHDFFIRNFNICKCHFHSVGWLVSQKSITTRQTHTNQSLMYARGFFFYLFLRFVYISMNIVIDSNDNFDWNAHGTRGKTT